MLYSVRTIKKGCCSSLITFFEIVLQRVDVNESCKKECGIFYLVRVIDHCARTISRNCNVDSKRYYEVSFGNC